MKQGLFGKYILAKDNGDDINPRAKYFVLRYDAEAGHGAESRTALRLYCQAIRFAQPQLADEFEEAIRDEARKAWEISEELEGHGITP
jgi:hypothetical protein